MAINNRPNREPNNQRVSKNSASRLRPREIHTADWGEVPNQVLRDAIVSVTNAGAAIMFGRTSDKGAFSITILDGDERIREWPHTVDECEQSLRWICGMFTDE